MELNKKLKQLSVHNLSKYDSLKGKVVDKVAFNNRGEHDEQMFIITFTDGTFINIGLDWKEGDYGSTDEPELGNQWISTSKRSQRLCYG